MGEVRRGSSWDSPLLVMDLVKTGIEGLDVVLGGGLVPGQTVLVEGTPGSGKTTLGIQFVINGALQFGEAGLIVTFEQFPAELYRDVAAFGWDLKALEASGNVRVLSTSPQAFQAGLTEAGGFLDEMLREFKIKRLQLDSLTHFARIAESPAYLRTMLTGLLNGLKNKGITSFLLKELAAAESDAIAFEEYMVDASLRLYNTPPAGVGEHLRTVEVRKTRGHPHVSGRHPFRILEDGIAVFPHLPPPAGGSPSEGIKAGRRCSTGVEGLDQMLTDGLLDGSACLVAGSAGVGKTILGLHFLHAGAKIGEPGLLVTFQEAPEKVTTFMAGFGMQPDELISRKKLFVRSYSPVQLCMEEFLWQLGKMIETHGIRRLMLDSLSDLEATISDPQMLRDYLFALLRLVERHAVTTLFTAEIPQITGDIQVSQVGYSFMVDTVILMRYVEVESALERVLSVLKSRGTAHDKGLRLFKIGDNGMEVGPRPLGLSGVMSGTAVGKQKEAIEQMAQPLTFIRDFTDLIRQGELDPASQNEILQQILEQVEAMAQLLCREYDLDYQSVMGGPRSSP
jgi:circadian clock protein KaiC